MGIAMVSFAEQESSLDGDNISDPASGSFSSISSSIYYKFFQKDKFDVYLSGAFPLVSDGNTFFSAGVGGEYFLTKENHRVTEAREGFKISISPTLRYFLIGEVNLIYLSYLTDSSKKSDINIEFAGGGGATYAFGGSWDGWGIRASGVLGRGLGVISSTFNVRLFGSVVYFLD